MFAPTNATRQIAYCYGDEEIAEALTEVGLTGTPVPERPFSVELPDGRTLTGRDDWIGGAMDEPGSSRTILNIA